MTPVSEAGPPNPICMAAIYITDGLVFIFLRPLVNGVDLVFQSIAMTCNSLALVGITLMGDVVKETGAKFSAVAIPLRVALSGDTATPSIDITVKLVGKERTLDRIDRAIKYIEEAA